MSKVQSNKFLVITSLLLLVAVLLGALSGVVHDGLPGFSFVDMPFTRYLFNNLKVCSFIILLGTVSFGFLPLVNLLYNGFFIGISLKLMLEHFNIATVLALLSHGLFELPALIISVYAGRLLSRSLFNIVKYLFNKKEDVLSLVKELFKTAVKAILLVVLLLLIASLIESIPRKWLLPKS